MSITLCSVERYLSDFNILAIVNNISRVMLQTYIPSNEISGSYGISGVAL